MGGKASGGGLGGGAGKGGGGGGGAVTPAQAAALSANRNQNIFTTVGGLNYAKGTPGKGGAALTQGPGGKAPGGLTTPPNPRIRPTGPGGPGADGGVPLPPMRPADASPGAGISAATLPGAYGRSVVPNAQTGLPEGMAAPSLASIFAPTQMSPGGPPLAGAEAEARRRRAEAVAAYYGTRV